MKNYWPSESGAAVLACSAHRCLWDTLATAVDSEHHRARLYLFHFRVRGCLVSCFIGQRVRVGSGLCPSQETLSEGSSVREAGPVNFCFPHCFKVSRN